MAVSLKNILTFIFLAAILNAAHILPLQPIHGTSHHPSANNHPLKGGQPVSLTIEDGSHEELISQSSLQNNQSDEYDTDKIQFMITAIPEKPVFPFRRPPKIS